MAKISWRPLLQQLIADNTISSGNAQFDHGNLASIEKLANALETAGFSCAIQLIPNRKDKANLIARYGGSKESASETGLVFAGHIDTVPYDDQAWASDPFTLTERDQKLYGLGTSDMKGFIALAAQAISQTPKSQLKNPLTLLVSADEECGMDGAQTLLKQGYRPGRYCVIGEPTGLVPIRQHKGIFMETIEAWGASGHSSNPALGRNAVESLSVIVQAIREFRDELASRQNIEAFPVSHSTINLGAIHGGDNANRIPAHCRLDIDLRFLPGNTVDKLRQELHQRIDQAAQGLPCRITYKPLFNGTPAFKTEASSPIVKACERFSGHPAQAVNFGTEGAFYNQLGMESVILGPGDIEQAHQPDEFLALERIKPMQDILNKLIQHFCLVGA